MLGHICISKYREPETFNFYTLLCDLNTYSTVSIISIYDIQILWKFSFLLLLLVSEGQRFSWLSNADRWFGSFFGEQIQSWSKTSSAVYGLIGKRIIPTVQYLNSTARQQVEITQAFFSSIRRWKAGRHRPFLLGWNSSMHK